MIIARYVEVKNFGTMKKSKCNNSVVLNRKVFLEKYPNKDLFNSIKKKYEASDKMEYEEANFYYMEEINFFAKKFNLDIRFDVSSIMNDEKFVALKDYNLKAHLRIQHVLTIIYNSNIHNNNII